MKPLILILSISLFFALQSSNSLAQEKLIKGVVTTFDSIPLIGAKIKASKSKETVETDSLGQFEIKCQNKDKLKISAEGFYNQVAKIEDKTKYAAINLDLKPGMKNKEHALGITDVSYHNKLNALASLGPNDVDFSQYHTMREAIEGKIPGVAFVGGNIVVRGSSNLQGPQPALIIVDGVPVNSSALNSMNPATVRSVNVIKDGSSAMYGSRGANGVVIIETKSAKELVD